MPKLDEATLLARIAAFAAKPTPDGATALAQTGDERTLPALVHAMTDTMEGQDVVRYRQAVRQVGTAPVLRRMLAGALADRRVAAHALTAHDPEHAPLALVSKTPKHTLDALDFQLSVWYKINSFISDNLKLEFDFIF